MRADDDAEPARECLRTAHVLSGAWWSVREAARADARWLALTILASLALALLPAAQVRAVAWTVDAAAGDGWREALAPLIVLTLLVALSQLISSADNLTGQRASLRLRTDLFRRVGTTTASLTPQQVADARVHDLVEGARNATFAIARSPVAVIKALSALVAALALGLSLWTFSPLAAGLVVLALVPDLIVFAWAARMQDEQYEHEARHDHRARYLLDLVTDQRSATDLITLGTGRRVALSAAAARGRAASVADGIYARLLRGDLLGGIATAGLLAGALLAVLAEDSGAPGIAAGVLGVVAGLQATRGAGYAMGDVISAAPLISRFRALEELRADTSDAQEVIDRVDTLEAHDLTVTYSGADRPALVGASLRAQRGQLIALVGVNGSGKTTLVNALLGVVTAQQGHVLADGGDLISLPISQRLARFSLVTQEFGRYEMTVREAVALGSPCEDVTDAEIWQALEEARARELVERMPGGLDTMLGTQFSGVGLSGGQWQRIAVARIALRGAGIRILDEPTSAIDAEAEQEVFAQLRHTAAEHITIVVSHRAWTLRDMDRIYVLENGRIIEQGTFAKLSRPGTRFAQLFAQQVHGDQDDAGSDADGLP